jgi:hypothetical protein
LPARISTPFPDWLPRRTWPLAAVAAAGLSIPFITRREMRFSPPVALGVALAAVIVLSLLGRSRIWRRLDLALTAAVGLAAASQHLLPGLVFGMDAKDHLWGAYGYLQAWSAGDFLPIWLHHLGPGMPMPLLYGPLAFWAMAPAALAGCGAAGMYASSFVLASVGGALGARSAVLAWTRDRRAALLAAVAFSFAPGRLIEANYVSGLGGTWAIALLPLIFLGFERTVNRGAPRDFALAATAAALAALAHPVSLITFAFLLPVLWLCSAVLRPLSPRVATQRAAVASGAALAGILLAGFFTLPLLAEKKFLFLDDSIRPADAYADEAAFPAQLVDRQLWDTIRWSRSVRFGANQFDDDMPFYQGVVALAALVAAIFTGRRSRSARTAVALGALGLAAVASAVFPTARWVALIPGIPTLQFPVRFLAPATAAAALAAGLLAARARGARSARPLAALAALAFLADGFALSGAVRRMPPWQGLASFDFAEPTLAAVTPVPAPWPLRVAGSFLPPTAPGAQVGFVAEIGEHGMWPPFREDLTPAAHALIQSGDWATLAVGRIGSSRATLQKVRPLPWARFSPRRSGAAQAVAFERAAGRITVRLPPSGGTLVIAEQYFPGWRVRTGREWREAEAGSDGLMRIRVPRGVRSVELRFDRWRTDRLLGWIASGLTLAFLVTLALRPRRRQRLVIAPR